jgi:hypothetical protein
MINKNKRWTADEERVIADQVSRHANNLTLAFNEAARLLERTPGAVTRRWYNKCCKESICFATIGYKKKNINRKVISNNTSDNTEVTTISWWRRISKLLGLN